MRKNKLQKLAVIMAASFILSSAVSCKENRKTIEPKIPTEGIASTTDSGMASGTDGELGPEGEGDTFAPGKIYRKANASGKEMASPMDARSINVLGNRPEENCGTAYEVFVYSFNDSNGDGIGDLKGLTEKLDYINDGDPTTTTDLGCDTIWLMPIMPSTTYHKYDVTDYKSIDPEYGSMEDFDTLVTEAHKRHTKILVDLVMNHTSSRHPWFQEACKYIEEKGDSGELDAGECPYVDYYHFTREPQGDVYYQVGSSGWYYEAEFWSEMPDLNLESEAVRNEFKDITGFWIDHGVDGFRLDATTQYVTGDDKANIEILAWLNQTVKEKKSDAYIVGEAWADSSVYEKYYASGVDSFFDFSFATNNGYIARTLNRQTRSKAATYGKMLQQSEEEINTVIASQTDASGNGDTLSHHLAYTNAPFYTNHDTGRSAGFYHGDTAEAKTKMAEAMNLLMSGKAFLYYGEELGMKGAGKDENARLGMNWYQDASKNCKGPKDADAIEQTYGSLEEQEDDPNSIYWFVRHVLNIRNTFPEISHGETKMDETLSSENISAVRKTYEGSETLIILNLSEDDQEVDLANVRINGKKISSENLVATILTSNQDITFKSGKLYLPFYSGALIK